MNSNMNTLIFYLLDMAGSAHEGSKPSPIRV